VHHADLPWAQVQVVNKVRTEKTGKSLIMMKRECRESVWFKFSLKGSIGLYMEDRKGQNIGRCRIVSNNVCYCEYFSLQKCGNGFLLSVPRRSQLHLCLAHYTDSWLVNILVESSRSIVCVEYSPDVLCDVFMPIVLYRLEVGKYVLTNATLFP